jgi:hypothetical protein
MIGAAVLLPAAVKIGLEVRQAMREANPPDRAASVD